MDASVTRGPQMTEDPNQTEEPRNLRFLRQMVTVLMGVMIVGIVTIVGLLAVRLSRPSLPPLPELPEQISLPDGVHPQALTAAPGWYGVVTDDARILIYDAQSGALRQEVPLAPQQ